VFEPKLSIVIPVYNGANYLREAIDSALGQTYENVEVIVVNDGSNDGGETEKVARSYGSRIRYFKKENGGVASALNCGIRNMTGQYLSWLSHDDVYYPFKLDRQIKMMGKLTNKEVVLYSDFEMIDRAGNSMSKVAIEPRITKTALRAILSTSIHGCSTLVPKEVIGAVGLFNENLKTTQDNEMWLRIYMKGYSFMHLPEILIKSRVHEAQGQRRLASVNRTETKSFYSWALNACRKNVAQDAGGLFGCLAMKEINLPLSILRSGTSNKGVKISCPILFKYKGRVYARKLKRLLGL
jgi:glycosyltransferase involved in cell wall biosynthesis